MTMQTCHTDEFGDAHATLLDQSLAVAVPQIDPASSPQRHGGGHNHAVRLLPGTAALVAPLDLVERALASVSEPGPVIIHPAESAESAWSVLLVRAATPVDQPQVATLADHRVGYVGAGHSLDLPPTRFADGALTWRQAPVRDQTWPPFAVIAQALLDADLG